jgi:hypothetical protein
MPNYLIGLVTVIATFFVVRSTVHSVAIPKLKVAAAHIRAVMNPITVIKARGFEDTVTICTS